MKIEIGKRYIRVGTASNYATKTCETVVVTNDGKDIWGSVRYYRLIDNIQLSLSLRPERFKHQFKLAIKPLNFRKLLCSN